MRWFGLVLAAACVSSEQARADACAAIGEATPLRIARIAERAEPVTDDGGLIRLYGVRVPRGGEAAAARAMRDWLVGRDVVAEDVTAEADRWGRRVARLAVSLQPGAAAGSVATKLVGAGLAQARPEPGAAACLRDLFAAEDSARRERRGLWADAARLPIMASARAALAAHDGDWVIVEGRVAGVGETASRVFLNYGPTRGADFSATVLKSRLKRMRGEGFDPATLIGVSTRVRGLVDARFGPRIEIVYPSTIEVTD